ncbi:hypothetical protein KR044_007721, partial [Drosophila immigrans]
IPPPPPAPPQPQPQPQPQTQPAETTTSFLAEVLSALYGDTTGHPEHGSFSYHKAAERYALTGDGHLAKRSPTTAIATALSSSDKQQRAHLTLGFERAARALYERNKLATRQGNNNSSSSSSGCNVSFVEFDLAKGTSKSAPSIQHFPQSLAPNASDDAGLAGSATPSNSNELSHIYLQLLQQQLPQQQAQQQQHLVAGAPSNMSMPIYGLACGHANDITQVYAQLLAANLRQNVAQQQHQQQHHQQQQQQQQQQSSSAAAAAILYEAILQQRVLQQLQQQQMQHHAQQQQQQQQQQSRTPRGIFGGNCNLSGTNKTPQPDNK